MNNRSARLELSGMPRDPQRALGSLRQTLCASFNYCRRYPAKLAVLKATLKYCYNYIVQFEKSLEEQQTSKSKATLEAEAKELGIDLDSRKTLENMELDFEAALDKAALDKAEVKQVKESK